MAEGNVRLVDGPCDGRLVPRPSERSLLIEGEGVPEGYVARYRMTRDRDVYRFKELDQVTLRVERSA